mmetsp:Transcript_110717/g.174530  ORF Transcript_110717/g.174530 Transcript_110717/m.174530 type:complete len:129 (-) Transcript_110717:1228-1614(-)
MYREMHKEGCIVVHHRAYVLHRRTRASHTQTTRMRVFRSDCLRSEFVEQDRSLQEVVRRVGKRGHYNNSADSRAAKKKMLPRRLFQRPRNARHYSGGWEVVQCPDLADLMQYLEPVVHQKWSLESAGF